MTQRFNGEGEYNKESIKWTKKGYKGERKVKLEVTGNDGSKSKRTEEPAFFFSRIFNCRSRRRGVTANARLMAGGKLPERGQSRVVRPHKERRHLRVLFLYSFTPPLLFLVLCSFTAAHLPPPLLSLYLFFLFLFFLLFFLLITPSHSFAFVVQWGECMHALDVIFICNFPGGQRSHDVLNCQLILTSYSLSVFSLTIKGRYGEFSAKKIKVERD